MTHTNRSRKRQRLVKANPLIHFIWSTCDPLFPRLSYRVGKIHAQENWGTRHDCEATSGAKERGTKKKRSGGGERKEDKLLFL
ncbi:hypothetical protein L2E82_50118 [Cichorium intybus]|nr:hypothetical protein L2E82_50118 [Cichorium intybus]